MSHSNENGTKPIPGPSQHLVKAPAAIAVARNVPRPHQKRLIHGNGAHQRAAPRAQEIDLLSLHLYPDTAIACSLGCKLEWARNYVPPATPFRA